MKLYLIWKTLCFRQEHKDLFQEGEYLPLAAAGTKADHVIAFARKFQGSTALVIVPRLVAGLLNEVNMANTDDNAEANALDFSPLGTRVWGDSHVSLPCKCREKYRNVLTGEVFELEGQISASQAFAEFPVALLVLE
jgi:(1->4)-alpha-D-glucan 1-alpha-D-glucosylmutase